MATYTIIDTIDLETLDFAELLTTSPGTARKSVDGASAVISWQGETPNCVTNIQTGPHLSASEMRDFLNNPDWIHPDPFHVEQ